MNLMKRAKHIRRRFLRGAEGMSAVEMALVLPALLLMFSGIMDFGNLYLQRNLVAAVAGDGARRASVSAGTDTPLTQSTLQSALRTDCNNDHLTVTMIPSPPTPSFPVTVTVTLTVPILTPGINTIFTSLSIPVPVTVTGQCIMQAQAP